LCPNRCGKHRFHGRGVVRHSRFQTVGGKAGDPHAARLVLRDLVNASVGFEALAAETKTPSKSLHRMLSDRGNPSMDNLAAIFGVVQKRLGVCIRTQTVKTT
jgi:DNA-binding phage protein